MKAPETLLLDSATPPPSSVPGWKRSLGKTLLPAALACCGLSGCTAFWDDVTARDFEFQSLYTAKPNPLLVLRDSTDADQRAKAYRALREPAQYGGTPEEQEAVVKVLCTGLKTERTAWCRLAAVSSLRTFKDPRAAAALIDAYYEASAFEPEPVPKYNAGIATAYSPTLPPVSKTSTETATMLRCQVLAALGETASPAAVELLIKVVKEPPVEGAEQDRQQKMQERLAAARALGHYKHYQATETLVAVLKTEKDPGLREAAQESLQLVTGKRIPQDGQLWEAYLHDTPDKKAIYTDGPSFGERMLEIVTVGWWK